MKKTILIFFLAFSIFQICIAQKSKLNIKVMTSSPEGFMVNSTLISGTKEAILIDAQFLLPDAKKVAEEIKKSGKKLTTVYVTHSHPDHYFGFNAIKEVFPDAKLVALPSTIDEIKKTWQSKVNEWQPMYKEAITANPIVPMPLNGSSLMIEGTKLEVRGPVQGDDSKNSYIWIPSQKTAICGDVVYNGVYPWTKETNPQERKVWIKTLDEIAALHPDMVVAGHKNPAMKDDISSVQSTKKYLQDYDMILPTAQNAEDFQAKMKEKHPGLQLDIILKLAAEAAFKK